MNTFEKYMDFIGEDPSAQMRYAFDGLMEHARAVRKRLGKKFYLLDRYMNCMLTAVNHSLAYCSSSDGFDTACELRGMCRDILVGRERLKGHPFYGQAKAYIEAHLLDCQEDATKAALYATALAYDFLEVAAKRFYEEQEQSVFDVLDIAELRELYRKICGMLGGEEEMQAINSLFRQRFLLITPINAYLQGLTDDLLYELTYQDKESSLTVFQLLLDE